MVTGNPHHKMHKKEVFWQHHMDCWSQTMLTQAYYCRKNGLSQSDFSKWKKKLKPYAKRKIKKKPFAIEHKNLARNIILGENANRCGFCGHPQKMVNKLFYGKDDVIAICDYCLWHKAQRLHQEVKYYKTIRFEKCSVCYQDKSGVIIGSVYYRICMDCLADAWSNLFESCPEKHPFRSTCISCKTKSPKEYMGIGAHILCQNCLLVIFKKFSSLVIDVNRCSFCQEERSEEKLLYGKGTRWICQNCAEKVLTHFNDIDQAHINVPKRCNMCGSEKQKGITFIASNEGQICNSCIYACYDLLHESEARDE